MLQRKVDLATWLLDTEQARDRGTRGLRRAEGVALRFGHKKATGGRTGLTKYLASKEECGLVWMVNEALNFELVPVKNTEQFTAL